MSEQKREFSAKIAETIKTFLEQEEVNFSFGETQEHGIFNFGIKIGGLIDYVDCSIRVNADSYVIHTRPPFRVDTKNQTKMAEMALFMTHANDLGGGGGYFFFNERSGEILYRVYVNCAGGIIPTPELVQNSIDGPCIMFEHYGPEIISIL